MEKKPAGIDLGTTYSCISCIDDFTEQPQVISNYEGDKVTPSVVYFENDNNIIVGKTAKENAVLEPEAACEFVKRKMGISKVAITYHGREYSPEQISSRILKKLVMDAEKALDVEIEDVVVTCPAYFGVAERAATKAAAEIAGLNVLEIINEPTAAALYYGCLRNVDGRVILVFDLGGGTFDVTIIKVTKEKIIAVATNGDHELGGKNWDDTIIDYFMDTFREHKGMDIQFELDAQQDLRNKAEEAKQELSFRERTIKVITVGGMRDRIELTREDFESMTSDKLRRTIDITRNTVEAAAKKGVDTIDEIIMVGGSCRMPMVEAALKAAFPRIKIHPFEPDEAVAKGAAIHAENLVNKRNVLQKWIDMLEESRSQERIRSDKYSGSTVFRTGELTDFIQQNGGDADEILGMVAGKSGMSIDELLSHSSRLVNITAKSFGIELVDKKGHSYVKNVIMKQSKVPTSVSKFVGTYEDNALTAELIVYETDEEEETFEISYHKPLGTATLELPGNLPARSRIQVTFSLSTDGLLVIKGKDMTSGNEVKAEMRSDSILSKEEILEQREALNAIQLI